MNGKRKHPLPYEARQYHVANIMNSLGRELSKSAQERKPWRDYDRNHGRQGGVSARQLPDVRHEHLEHEADCQ
jgi:hypothetical protein